MFGPSDLVSQGATAGERHDIAKVTAEEAQRQQPLADSPAQGIGGIGIMQGGHGLVTVRACRRPG